MKINNNEINIDDLVSEKYMHKVISKGIFLSEYQIEVLMRNNINPYECGNINDLIFQIDEAIENNLDDELDMISKEIMEFNYYSNTNK